MHSALVDSDHVYVAHVVAVDQRATLKVAERFKGNVKVGESLRLRSGGGGDCTLRFTAGERYLVYTTGAPESVFFCSRTRRLRQDDDAELKWLRSKILSTLPALLQRQEVTCQACDVYSVSGSLIGPSVSGTCNLPLRGEKDVAAGVATGKPFWANG